MFSHLDSLEQRAVCFRRVCTVCADKDNPKWTAHGPDCLLSQDIEERIQVTNGDLRIFIFGDAHGRGTQSPDARVMLRDHHPGASAGRSRSPRARSWKVWGAWERRRSLERHLAGPPRQGEDDGRGK
jgi:hypothetical protein